MSLQLQPKINLYHSCGECGTSGDDSLHLIEIFTYDDCEGAGKQFLCGHCIVGHEIPVNMQTEGWVFAEVIRYDSARLNFLVSSPDGNEEWVDVSRRPFVDYLTFIRSVAPTQEPLDCLGEFSFKHAGSCLEVLSSLSSFGSSSSIGTFEPATFGSSTYPLFDDEKLFDVEDLVFIDDDVQMKDSFESTLDSSSEAVSEENLMKPPMKRKAQATKTRSNRAANYWTKKEDKLLIKTMNSFKKEGIKPSWPQVAVYIPGRCGKQCRERYTNHLSSSLKPKEWDPNEDALIMHLFLKHGAKWSKISRLGLIGRTDNGVKNRFHHLRRWLERDYRKKIDAEDEEECMSDTSIHQKVHCLIADIATDSKAGVRMYKGRSRKEKYKFGKLRKVRGITPCRRCCLFAPSAYTGSKIDSLTGWCEACVSIPPYVMGDDLRACLAQRMALDDFMLE